MRHFYFTFAFLVGIVPSIIGLEASADMGCGPKGHIPQCDKSAEYSCVVMDASTQTPWVSIGVRNELECPAGNFLIRENVETGEYVVISPLPSSFYSTHEVKLGDRYGDPCVPPGAYRYGCLQPFFCTDDTKGSVPYYIECVVDYEENNINLENCKDITDLEVPHSTGGGKTPWADATDNTVCTGTCEDNEPQDAAAMLEEAKSVLSTNAMVALFGLAIFLHKRRRK